MISLLLSFILLLPQSWAKGRTQVDRSLEYEVNHFRELRTKVNQNCVQNPDRASYQLDVGGQAMNCADLFKVLHSIEVKIDKKVDALEAQCTQTKEDQLDSQVADHLKIARAAGSCQKKSNDKMCAETAACAMVGVAMPLISLLQQAATANGSQNECAQAGNNCMHTVFQGVMKSLWGTLTAVWDGVKWVAKKAWDGTKWLASKTGEMLGFVKAHEKSTSERALALQKTSPGFVAEFRANPVAAMKNLGRKIYNSLKLAAMETFGCEEWTYPDGRKTRNSAANDFSLISKAKCTSPMTDWDCASCLQKTQVFCGIGGLALGEIIFGVLTGGASAGASAIKDGIVGALKATSAGRKALGAGAKGLEATKDVFRVIPRSAEGLAGASRTALRATGVTRVLNASEKAAVNGWKAIQADKIGGKITKAAAAITVKPIAWTGKTFVVKPVGAYLHAIEEGTKLGYRTVDGAIAKATGKTVVEESTTAAIALESKIDNTAIIEDPRITPELKRMGALDDEARKLEALKHYPDLTEEQLEAVINAHNIGKEKGYFNYDIGEIREKKKILSDAGFTKEQVRFLMDNGITGTLPGTGASVLDKIAELPQGRAVGFQEGRYAMIDSQDTLAKIQKISERVPAGGTIGNEADDLMKLYKAQNRTAADGFYNKAITERDAQSLGHSWRLSMKAGDVNVALETAKQGVKEFGMDPKLIVKGIQAEVQRLDTKLVSATDRNNIALISEKKAYIELKSKFEREAGLVAPAQRPPVLPTPEPVAPRPQAVAEVAEVPKIPAATAPGPYRAPAGVPKQKIIDVANEYRLGINGRAKDPTKASGLYYQAEEGTIKNEVIRHIRGGGDETRFFDSKLYDAFTNSIEGDGVVARAIFDDAFKAGGEKYSSHYVNLMINEVEKRSMAKYSSEAARKNMANLARYIRERYGSGFYTQDQVVKRWINQNDW